MADSNTATDSTKPVDLDSIEVEILIIARNASVLQQSAQFLTRRGWPTVVYDNISKAIEYIAEKKPDFILLSLNHPSPSIAKLPDLIVQTFNLSCIGFVEIMDGASTNKLNASKLRHKLTGQPSGPSLQRYIRKMLADRFGVDESKDSSGDAKLEKKGEKGGAAITVKGENGSDNEYNVKIEGQGAGGEFAAAGGSAQEMTGGSTTVKSSATRRSLKSLTGDIGSNAAGNLLNGEVTQSDSKSAAEMAASLKASILSEGDSGATDMSQEEADAEAAAARAANSGYDPSVLQNSGSSTGSAAGITNADGSSSSSSSKGGRDLTAAATEALSGKAKPVGYEGGNDKAGPNYDSPVAVPFRKKPEGEGHASLVSRAIETAIRGISVFPKEETYADLSQVSEVVVFSVDSAVVSGYIVIGWKSGEDVTKEFMNAAETAMRGCFADMQVAANIESGFVLTVPPVQFREWMSEKATFGFSIPHKTAELGVGFLALGRPLPKAKASQATDMYQIEIVDMSTTQPVNFQAYLNMEANQKYVLYLRAGRVLQPEQKQRLIGAKVKDFFTKSVDLQNVRKFFAATYIVDSIRDFLKDKVA